MAAVSKWVDVFMSISMTPAIQLVVAYFLAAVKGSGNVMLADTWEHSEAFPLPIDAFH